jgi:hypothetical protein
MPAARPVRYAPRIETCSFQMVERCFGQVARTVRLLRRAGHEHPDSGRIDAIDEGVDGNDGPVDANDRRIDGFDRGIAEASNRPDSEAASGLSSPDDPRNDAAVERRFPGDLQMQHNLDRLRELELFVDDAGLREIWKIRPAVVGNYARGVE